MNGKAWCSGILASLCTLSLLLGGCGDEPLPPAPMPDTPPVSQVTQPPPRETVPAKQRQTRTEVLMPQLLQTQVYQNEVVCVDASCTGDGYISVRYTGDIEKIKLQLTMPSGLVYTYSLKPGDFQVFPLSGGDGTYTVAVYENAYDKMYALAFSQQFSVTLSDPFKPYLYPNQYVWYSQETETYRQALSLSQLSQDDMDFVRQVYQYIIENVDYDKELAEHVPKGYLPDVDRTLTTKKGICFDYASLMTAMLRMQGIPTKLVIGYSGEQYHAWIDVYLDQVGWIDNIIYFDGKNWSLIDPTLGANSSSSKVKKYLGDGTHYIEKYHY